MHAIYVISIILISIGITLFLLSFIFEYTRKQNLKKRTIDEYAIIIPARNESKVIKNLLDSIKLQNPNMNNVYVIVEDKKDETVKIVKEYGGNIYVRKNIENRRRKGYALDECLKNILKKKHYDLYFIMDADNILGKNFISEMLKTYKKGYDIATSYRNIKNSSNIISSCSGLTFSFMNTLFNEYNNHMHKSMIISGTGFYISGELVEKLNGYPFHSLTEDYELTLYAEANNISSYYNKNAIFYDEQPTKMKDSIKQRTRWVKGFLEARKIRLKDIKDDYSKLMGIIPYLFVIVGIAILFITNFSLSIHYLIKSNNLFFTTFKGCINILLITYLLLAGLTFYVILKENNKLNMSLKYKILSCLYNPIFLSTYIYCFIKALVKKDLAWEEIKHEKTQID